MKSLDRITFDPSLWGQGVHPWPARNGWDGGGTIGGPAAPVRRFFKHTHILRKKISSSA